ncbi:hypothetical protein [Kitasatospora viridis]|uniref:Uncharacterized protein n=1 Tax=Kitasatospora viridis TaxID=281105 RepID=A0A561TT86_9ACTN|nr:hypothetical protein [Kitasatospora viridis]TWF90314.1 hypothetical protein FHX73_13358 [Kitasatospora viridis]
MSGQGQGQNHNYYGDVVHMHGGSGNTGIDKRGSGASDLAAELGQLRALVGELRAAVPAGAHQVLDDSLATAESGSAPGRERRGALATLSAIAATAGSVGTPVVELVTRILALIKG